MITDFKQTALSLYTPQFKYYRGYIWDATNKMLSDDGGQNSVQRVRGWGEIQKLPHGEKIQDTVGELIAQALTEFWNKNNA